LGLYDYNLGLKYRVLALSWKRVLLSEDKADGIGEQCW